MTSWSDRLSVAAPRTAVVLHDLAMVWLCWIGLHQFRHSVMPNSPALQGWSIEIALILISQGLIFWRVGLYRGVWRFASVPDLLNIVKAAVLGLLAIVLVLFLYNRLDQVPRSVLVLYPLMLAAMLGMPRLLYRTWKDHGSARTSHTAIRVLILGAGQAGETLVRDLRRTGAYDPVGFLDDAPKLRGSQLQGVPVLGRVADRPDRARDRGQAAGHRDALRRRVADAGCGRRMRAHRPAVPHGPQARRPARRAVIAR